MTGDVHRPPAPDPFCPVCGSAYPAPTADTDPGTCQRCGLDLAHPSAARIRLIDAQRAHLVAVRADLAAELMRLAPTSRHVPTRLPRDTGHASAPTATTAGPPVTEGVGHDVGVPAILGISGAVLLTAAAVVFTAVTWERLPAAGQATVLVVATLAAAAGAIATHRRGLASTSATLGVLATALAGTVVVGAQRTGLATFAGHTSTATGVALAATGASLARSGIRWVPSLGAIGLLGAGVSATAVTADTTALGASRVALLGVVLAAVVAASSPLWPSAPARWITATGAAGLAAACGLVGVVELSRGEVPWPSALAPVLLAVVLFCAATPRRPAASGIAALLVSGAVVAGFARFGVDDSAVLTATAGVTAAGAWITGRLRGPYRRPTRLGLLPVTVIAGVGGAAAVSAAVTRWLGAVVAEPGPSVDGWLAAAAVLLLVAVCAAPGPRRRWPTLVLGGTIVVVAALATTLAAVVTLIAAGAVVAALPEHPADRMAGLVAASIGAGFVAGDAVALAAAASVTALLAVTVVATSTGVRSRVAAGFASASIAVAVTSGLRGLATGDEVALTVGVGVAFIGAITFARLGTDAPPTAGVVVGGLATVVAPLLSADAVAAGTMLLSAAAGWFVLALSGRRALRWISAASVSVGNAVLVGHAGVEVVEAYTGPAALALLAAGAWWLAEDEQVPTLAALGPGLSVAATPSLLVLFQQPDGLSRTVVVTLAAAATLVAGVRTRWLAPTLAGTVGAIGVASIQLFVLAAQAPRWAAFAVAGAVLVWMGASYERQQQRARALMTSLRMFR